MIFIIPTNTCLGLSCPINDLESFKNIYKIKNRPLTKTLSIMIGSFSELKEKTFINKTQINFLKKYKRPFTIILKPKIDLIDKNIPNKNLYNKTDIAFRIAHNEIQKNTIKKYGPLFLTSLNKSGDKEIYDINKAKHIFELKNINIEILGKKGDNIIKSSDIFKFIGDSTEIKYIRKK